MVSDDWVEVLLLVSKEDCIVVECSRVVSLSVLLILL